MIQDLKLILNLPPQQSFFPGSEVSGVLSFQVTGATERYSNVQISLFGRAHVSWRTEDDEFEQGGYYAATREYVHQHLIVWSRDQAPNGMLYPGSYSFPFQFMIPNQRLPPTFGRCLPPYQQQLPPTLRYMRTGSIRYGVKGRISTPEILNGYLIEAALPFSEVVDTNIRKFRVPARAAVTKTICCWCCASGPITLTAEIPRTGFCIGEAIPLNVHLENGSNRQIQISVTLHQRVVLTAEGGQTSDGHEVLRLLSGPMQPRTPSQWSPGDNFVIPLLEPTLASRDIIELEYFLKVSTQIPRADDFSLNIPITIGNVPRQDPD